MSGWADIALDNRKRTNIIENGVEYREEEFTFPDGTKSWWVNDCFAYGEYQDNISRTDISNHMLKQIIKYKLTQ